MKSIAKQIPLQEITLRKYESPQGNDPYELTRMFCLSIGLLNPGDSRDIVTDVLYVLLFSDRPMTALEIKDRVETLREQKGKPLRGIALSNILRQIRRLRESMIVEKHLDSYRIAENEKLAALIDQKVFTYRVHSIVNRIKEYAEALDQKRNFHHTESAGSPHNPHVRLDV
jgi:hypothetical protein